MVGNAVAATMNPFAYDLKSTFNRETLQMEFWFKLNAPAKSLQLIITDHNGNDYVLANETLEDDDLEFYYLQSLDQEMMGRDFTWRVDVTSYTHDDIKLVSNTNKLYYPTSIDIDNNPENANFGTVFCIEGRGDGRYDNKYISHYDTNGAGLYIFNADGTPRPLPRSSVDGFGLTDPYDVERYGYNGGINRNTQGKDFSGTTGFAPYRVRVSDDGRVFITCMTTDGEVLYEAPKETFSATTQAEWKTGWNKVISTKLTGGTVDNPYLQLNTTDKNLYTKSSPSQFVAGPNIGFDVRGAGRDLQLLMLSGSLAAIHDPDFNNNNEFRCDEYNLGKAKIWAKSPRFIFDGDVLIYNAAQVQYDKNGNVYMCQLNYNSKVTLKRYNKDGASEEVINHEVHRCGAMRFNENFTKFALATKGNGTGGAVTIYDVLDNGDINWGSGIEYNIENEVGLTTMDFAWDYADNLYVAADFATENKGRCVAIFAMPNKEGNNSTVTISTPAASKYVFPEKNTVTWKSLFLRNQDVADEVKNTGHDHSKHNVRLWRLLQVGYHEYRYRQGQTWADKTQVPDIMDNNNELSVQEFFAKENRFSVMEFFANDPKFSWLGDYISEVTGELLDTDQKCRQYADDFINRKGAFNGEKGKPDAWRPLLTKAVWGLSDQMSSNEYMPIAWNWSNREEQYFDTIWVPSWHCQDLSINNVTDYSQTSRPSQWYKFNTTSNRHDFLGHPNISDETHILAWRDGSATGDIVHRVTRPNMELHATYVEKNIDENDPPADPENYDATNDDLFQLFDNRNYKPEDPSVVPTHDLTVTRRLAAGMYNTICLPMNIELAGLQEQTDKYREHPLKYKEDGSGAKVLEFTGVNATTNAAGENITILNFTQVTEMRAGVPYIVMLRDGSEDYTDKMPFTAVSVHANELHPVNIGGIKFVPTINPTTIPAQSLILVANNRLALTTEEGTMAGLRGYFQITDPNPARAQELAEQAADGRIMLNFKQPVSTSVVVAPESESNAVSIVRKVMQNNNIYILRGEEMYTIMGERVR
jgi:hypothetical protein